MKIYTIILYLLLLFKGFAQPSNHYFFASKHCRDSVSTNLVLQIDATVPLPFNENTYGKWTSAFWAMELMLYRPKDLEQKIPEHLQAISKAPVTFQRAFFEMLYTLYPKSFVKNVDSIYFKLVDDKIKAMALEYMAIGKYFYDIKVDDSFRQSAYYPLYFSRWHTQHLLPCKNDFLDTSFLPGQTVVFSFQSTDRNIPGYLMIRDSNGKWLLNNHQKPLQFQQLARSISNLPYYLTNGNTPQGLYKVVGIDSSNNNWIGPTTNLQMVMPFENTATSFFGIDTLYRFAYQTLLGPLQKFIGLHESFEAGKLGRSEIIAHGTTINPAFYQSQTYYPLTPSMGCLCSPEIWNNAGVLVESVQQKWIDVLLTISPKPTYLIVAEVNDL